MTHAEIIAAARQHAFSGGCSPKFLAICKELLRLYYGQPWSSVPPTKPGMYFWKKKMDDEPIMCDPGQAVMNADAYGGFWLGPITPADSAALAELRAFSDKALEELNSLRRIAGQSGMVCLTCHGVGRVGGIGPLLVRRAPIESVVVTDKRPFQTAWYDGSRELPNASVPESANLPRELYARLTGFDKNSIEDRWKIYWPENAAAANAALSAALLVEARAALEPDTTGASPSIPIGGYAAN